jgi:hypothetical protein
MNLRLPITMTPPSPRALGYKRGDGDTSPSRTPRRGGVLIAIALLLSGCVGGANVGSACRTTEDTLANLRDGMTYSDVVRLIGCQGTVDRRTDAGGNPVTVARWSGPGQSTFGATIITFRNDRMVAFAVNGQ